MAVTVYAWYPWAGWRYVFGALDTSSWPGTSAPTTGKAKAVGHATLSIGGGRDLGGYVSWCTGSVAHTFDEDLEAYGIKPHRQVRIDGLDEPAMRTWWRGMLDRARQGVVSYTGSGLGRLRFNCAEMVAQALDAGGGRQLAGDSWYASNMFWSPRDALRYAAAIAGALARGG